MLSKAGLDPLLDILAAEVGRFHKEDSDALGESVPELFVVFFQPPEPGPCIVGCRLEFFQESLDGRYVGPVVGVEDLEEEVLGEIGLVNLSALRFLEIAELAEEFVPVLLFALLEVDGDRAGPLDLLWRPSVGRGWLIV